MHTWLANTLRSVDRDANSSAIDDNTSPLPPHFTIKQVAETKYTLK